MKTIKKVLMFVMVLSMVVTAVPSTVEAKAKAYKTKTVKVTEGKEVTIKTKKKIKSVKISSKDKTFEAEKCGSKKFYVAWTTYGVKQTVKVKYTNGRTQKFNIKTVPDKYAQKIVDELKPLLDNPDEGLKTVIHDTVARLKALELSCACERHDLKLQPETITIEGKVDRRKVDIRRSKSLMNATDDEISELFKDFSVSEKQAFIISAYVQGRMGYSLGKKNRKITMKDLYNGTFSGQCSCGARAVEQVCKYLGIKTKRVSSMELNHEWCCVYVKDKDGNAYWRGIDATSNAYDMKTSLGKGPEYTAKQVKKHLKSQRIGLRAYCIN